MRLRIGTPARVVRWQADVAQDMSCAKCGYRREFAKIPGQWHFAPVLDTGEFVFLSGITGVHPDQSLCDDPETQFRDAFRFVGMHLQAAGLHFGDIVEMTTYHVGLRKHLSAFIRIKDEFIASPYPAWTAIGVTELITDGTLLEIRVIAQRP
jgi:enamine deaminase RidA (YjgF/YER057c/UK114 family)